MAARSVTGKTFVIVSEALEHGCLRDRLVAAPVKDDGMNSTTERDAGTIEARSDVSFGGRKRGLRVVIVESMMAQKNVPRKSGRLLLTKGGG